VAAMAEQTTAPDAVVAGATGYIGHLLCQALLDAGRSVRALARDPDRARDLEEEGCEIRKADVLEPDSLPQALEGAKVAYYLVHSMGRGSKGDFVELDRQAALNFSQAAAKAGVDQIIYLGGLASGGSEHLESRHATAGYLGSAGVPVTYLQAAAVIGAGSESYRTLYWLVKRLPVMVTPRWTSTRTQPIAVRDVIAYLVAAPETPGAKGQVIQIGGPDVTTYGGMFSELASAMGKRPPLQVKIPLLTPKLSSHWIGLVTPVDAGVAKPLIEGLTVETVVDDPSGMALFDISPTPITEAMKLALIEQGVAPAHS